MSLNQNVSLNKNESVMYKTIVDKIFSCTNEHLLLLMNQMISTADKKLFDLSEKAQTNEDQMKYMDCTRIFRTEKNDLGRHFFVNLNNSLTSSQDQIELTDNQELSLVDQDEMEEMVAITTMHAKAMNIYGEEARHLEARLEFLELMYENVFDKEALDPKHICQIFQKTIENLDIAIEAKLVFYKLFDQEVCSKLGVMYKALNQIFIDHEIMPEIIMKTTKQEEIEHIEEEDEVSSEVASCYKPGDKPEKNYLPASDNKKISHIVSEFMSGDITVSDNEIELPESFMRAPTQQDIEGKNRYDRKEVLKSLSTLQRKLTSMPEQDKCLSSEEIKQEILADISTENGGIVDKQVNLLDERSIDFVGMMFGAIANDETVSEIMTSLIYQLQIPVMKVAMLDKQLFDEEQHPARATVDLLTEAGKGIDQKEDNIYGELEDVVNSILDKFEIDIQTFEKAVDELEAIIENEETLSNEAERQQQKEILQKHARNIIINQLKMVSCDKKIPDSVRPLVLKHWSTLMLNRYIRHGRSSEQWVQSVLLLKLLLRCMQPIRFQSQYKMIETNHSALLEAVNDELYATQQDKDEISVQITQLKTHFLQLINDYNHKIVDEDSEAETITEEELINDSNDGTVEELEKIKQQTEIVKRKIAQLDSSARPGVWYEVYNGEDKPIRRLKLSVILTDAAQVIFVDRKGIKVIEKDVEDFAKELEENRSRLLADHSTFDHALGQVINALAA
jgi:Protein of unknown function (DUF1631)